MVWKSFTRNRCPVRASALAYATVLALIPMLAVAMSITSGLLKKQGEDQIDQFIVKLVASVTPSATISTNSADAADQPTGQRPTGPPRPTVASQREADHQRRAAPGAPGETNQSRPPASAEAEQAIKARHAMAR